MNAIQFIVTGELLHDMMRLPKDAHLEMVALDSVPQNTYRITVSRSDFPPVPENGMPLRVYPTTHVFADGAMDVVFWDWNIPGG